MSTVPADFSPMINSVHEVASHHLRKSLADVFRNCFTSGQVREGDYLFSRSKTLMRQYYESLPVQDQDTILIEFKKTTLARQQIGDAGGSILGSIRRKYSLAKDYKQVAAHLFFVVETASRRVDEENLMDQFSRVNAQRVPQSPPFGISSSHTDPFSDSHETTSLADLDVGNLDQVEMTVFQSETAHQAAVVLGLRGRDGRTQEVAATIPFAVGSDSGDSRVDSSRTVETATLSSFGDHEATDHPLADGDVGQ